MFDKETQETSPNRQGLEIRIRVRIRIRKTRRARLVRILSVEFPYKLGRVLKVFSRFPGRLEVSNPLDVVLELLVATT
jgi:hypothetical protein